MLETSASQSNSGKGRALKSPLIIFLHFRKSCFHAFVAPKENPGRLWKSEGARGQIFCSPERRTSRAAVPRKVMYSGDLGMPGFGIRQIYESLSIS